MNRSNKYININIEVVSERYILCLFCVLLVIVFTSCNKHTNNKVISDAESLMTTNPDSAYKLLTSISNPQKLKIKDYAAWCLWYTQAQYKLYHEIKSDSIINQAVSFYKKSNLIKEKGTSYYLQGCVYDLLKDSEKSMLAYKLAEDTLDGSTEYDIMGLTQMNIGYIYKHQGNYYQSNPCYKKALTYFLKSENRKYQVFALNEIGNSLTQLEYPTDSILLYYRKAASIAKSLNDTSFYYSIVSREGEILNNINIREAVSKVRIGFFHCPHLYYYNSAFLAYFYSKLNIQDSAEYFLKIAKEQKGTISHELLTNLAAGVVFERKGNYKQGFYAYDSAFNQLEKVYSDRLKNQLYRIDKQFDLTKKEKENNDLKLSNRTKVIWITILIIIVLIGLIVFQIVNTNHKKKQAELTIQRQKMEFELREKELENQTKFDLLMTKLQQRVEITLRFNKLQQRGFNPKKQEEMIEAISNQVILVESEWQYYIDETNRLYNNKIVELQQKYKELTRADLIVIVLIILGLDISDACCLLNSSKETMYMRRKRIKKRLKLEDDLEEWIRDNFKVN